jgi:PAT family beta-lactamase induction signal transducer AmpG
VAQAVPGQAEARATRRLRWSERVLGGVVANARVYADWRMVTIFFLGVSSGLPLALTLGTLSIWLARVGIDKTTIGLLGVVTLPYTLKFLWAPLIDRLPMPVIGRWLGRRRSWALATQLALAGAIIAMALTDPTASIGLFAVFALLVAAVSASQDVVIDAYRVEILDAPRYGAGAAVGVFGYRVGMLISGAGALYLADEVGWSAVYLIMAACVSIGIVTVLLSREPTAPERVPSAASRLGAFLRDSVIAPLIDFTRRRLWLVVLLFVLFYKFGDAMAGAMTGPFLVELGFSNAEIASVSKLYGFIATLVGLAIGGWMIARLGTFTSLWIAGIAQLLSNLLFALQAEVGHDNGMLALTIGLENFSGGIGTAALVAYLSGLCNLLYTATQYALLSALAAVARTVLSTPAGSLAEATGWITFFGITAALALPGLALLYVLEQRGALPRHAR